jgi:glycosyltransferase involved in cell wall biosynthesis
MLVTQISIGRFHHFHLARQLQRHSLLGEIWTGYPRFKLKDEHSIPKDKIRTFPWLQTPYMALGPLLDRHTWLRREWAWRAHQTLDRHVAASLSKGTILVGLSGSGRHSGHRAQSLGGRYICDRASSHIRYQDQMLREEYERWGLKFGGVDPRVIAKEEEEYAAADGITVPSQFCERSFVEMGVPREKLHLIPYGARLDRFNPMCEPDPDAFTVLFVGQVSIRKGILYLLEAFKKFNHPRKRLKVIGSLDPEIERLVVSRLPDNATMIGIVPNTDLARYYSEADILVLPSIEEGMAYVMGEAMSCGCPVIATRNTGAEELFEHGSEGFIVPIRSVEALVEALESAAQSRQHLLAMRAAARARMKTLSGWDTFGDRWVMLVNKMM